MILNIGLLIIIHKNIRAMLLGQGWAQLDDYNKKATGRSGFFPYNKHEHILTLMKNELVTSYIIIITISGIL